MLVLLRFQRDGATTNFVLNLITTYKTKQNRTWRVEKILHVVWHLWWSDSSFWVGNYIGLVFFLPISARNSNPGVGSFFVSDLVSFCFRGILVFSSSQCYFAQEDCDQSKS